MNQKTTTWIFIAIAIVYTIVKWIGLPLAEVFIKPLPVFLFAFVSWSESKYNRYLSVGFVFSGIGDVFLATYFGMFIPGLVSFLVAHVFYVVAFVKRSKQPMWTIALLSYTVGVIMLLFLYDTLGDLLIPVIFYISVILTMVWRSFAQKKTTETAFWAAYGSLFFAFSDSTIAFNKFVEPLSSATLIVMSTYWVAQYFIFLSRDRTNTNESINE